MAKTYPVISAMWNTRPRLRASNGPTSAPKADQAQIKPTNHSKFAGKRGRPTCHECYMCPSSKSKDKRTKEAQRLKSSVDVVPDYRLTTWRVVDTKSSMKLSGFSTIDILDYLDRIDRADHYYKGGDEDEDTQC
ncbi:uncharacterized protein LOC121804151 [Salvia splendens]|uniref:uncharacterized protein LOC121804151 n=1 Tax=Salvia splendens TaxID=180675 RepID=UPI001C252827|nr:uncharacterized protein LOC121804151 [Salvia splendens]